MTAGLDPLLALGVRLALALLLAVAAAHKLGDRARFAGVIAGYRVLPRAAAPAAAWAVALVEAGLALALLIGAPGALLAAAAVLLGYGALIGASIARGNDRIDCGCTGPAARAPGLRWGMVARNALIAALALAVALLPVAPRVLLWLDLLSLAAALAVAALLYHAAELLLALPKPGVAR